VLVATTAACAHATQAPSPSRTARTPFRAVDDVPDGLRWLGTDSRRAHRAGAKDLEVIAVDAGASGDRVSGMLSVPRDLCVLLLARAARSVQDVDLFAYGEDGAVLGVDEAPDASPAVMVCPPHPPRLFVAARVAAGHGLVAVGAQALEPAQAAHVARALGLSRRERIGLESWKDLEAVLASHRKTIGGRWQNVKRVSLPLNPRSASFVTTQIDQDSCVDVLVVPSRSASHLDVAALDSEGRVIGRAAAQHRHRAIIVCSSSSVPLTLKVRPQAGRGRAAVLISRSSRGSGPEGDALRLAYDATPTTELEEQHAKAVHRLVQMGYPRRPQWTRRAPLVAGHRHSHDLALPAGCRRLDVIAGRPVSRLEAWLWTADGQLIAADRGRSHLALSACTQGTKARLDVESVGAAGPHVVEMRGEGKTPNVLFEHPLAASRLLFRMRERGVIRKASELASAQTVLLEPTVLQTRDITVAVRRCLDVTLALGPGASGAEIRVWDQDANTEIDLARGTTSASSRICALSPPRAVRATLQLRAATGRATALLAIRLLAPDR
jgi:hypothetical protein